MKDSSRPRKSKSSSMCIRQALARDAKSADTRVLLEVESLCMPQTNQLLERLIGRDAEVRQLQAAVRKRQSKLIWGASDAGKTFLVTKMLLELPENERRKCICWSGAASRR